MKIKLGNMYHCHVQQCTIKSWNNLIFQVKNNNKNYAWIFDDYKLSKPSDTTKNMLFEKYCSVLHINIIMYDVRHHFFENYQSSSIHQRKHFQQTQQNIIHINLINIINDQIIPEDSFWMQQCMNMTWRNPSRPP